MRRCSRLSVCGRTATNASTAPAWPRRTRVYDGGCKASPRRHPQLIDHVDLELLRPLLASVFGSGYASGALRVLGQRPDYAVVAVDRVIVKLLGPNPPHW